MQISGRSLHAARYFTKQFKLSDNFVLFAADRITLDHLTPEITPPKGEPIYLENRERTRPRVI